MVFLKTISGETKKVDVETTITVSQLKAKIELVHPEFPAIMTRLIFAGAELSDQEEKTLLELGLKEESICHILLRAQQQPVPPPGYNNTQFKMAIPDHQVHYQLQMPPAYPAPAHVPGQNAYGQAPGQAYLQRIVVHEEDLSPIENQVVRASKYIRWFALLDAVFLLFIVLTVPFSIFLLGLILCICGYVGGRRLQLNFVYAYLCWKFFYVLFRMYALLLTNNAFTVIIFFLMILVDGYIIHLCLKLSRWVRGMTAVQKQRLVELTRKGFL